MSCHCRFCLVGALALTVAVGSLAFAQSQDSKKPTKPAAAATTATAQDQPPFEMTPEMMACIEAGTPGPMHEYLLEGVGTWHGTTTMWMEPGADPIVSETTSKVTSFMDGRYTKVEYEGEMPGMGMFKGMGIYGYDNVSQKFVSTWVDNHSTGIMVGTGERTSDGTQLNWEFTYNCPVSKTPKKMREVETRTGPNSMTLEMFGADLKTGKEFKMMEIAMERKASKGDRLSAAPGMISNKSAEAGCALCSYHIAGVKSCELAVKVDGKPYLVMGSNVDCHQFCGAKGPKPATVSGKIVDGKFVATKIDVEGATR